MLSREDCQKIIEQITKLSQADEVGISFNGGTRTHLRFSRNTVSTSGSANDQSISIRSTFGKRSGSVSINQVDNATIVEAVKRSEELARLAPEDPEFLPGLGPQKYVSVDGYSEKTANSSSPILAKGVKTCIEQASQKSLTAAGYGQTNAGFSCIANSNGLFGYQTQTSAYFSETARTKDGTGSGWSSQASHKIEDIDFLKNSTIACQKSLQSQSPRRLEPGKYVTILEPACVANLMQLMSFSMNARSADEGRSYFSAKDKNRLGETLFPKTVNLYSDPQDSNAPASPWGQSGLPQTRRYWLEKGVLRNLTYSRYWAQKQGKEPVPFPANLVWEGGQGSLEDLIQSTKKGVLVTSLWYIRSVDPQTLLYTGLTRDGVFWIENGKIAYPLLNFRWNDSPISVLKNIEAIAKPTRVPPRGSRSSNYVVPALKVKEFHFSSISEAV